VGGRAVRQRCHRGRLGSLRYGRAAPPPRPWTTTARRRAANPHSPTLPDAPCQQSPTGQQPSPSGTKRFAPTPIQACLTPEWMWSVGIYYSFTRHRPDRTPTLTGDRDPRPATATGDRDPRPATGDRDRDRRPRPATRLTDHRTEFYAPRCGRVVGRHDRGAARSELDISAGGDGGPVERYGSSGPGAGDGLEDDGPAGVGRVNDVAGGRPVGRIVAWALSLKIINAGR